MGDGAKRQTHAVGFGMGDGAKTQTQAVSFGIEQKNSHGRRWSAMADMCFLICGLQPPAQDFTDSYDGALAPFSGSVHCLE